MCLTASLCVFMFPDRQRSPSGNRERRANISALPPMPMFPSPSIVLRRDKRGTGLTAVRFFSVCGCETKPAAHHAQNNFDEFENVCKIKTCNLKNQNSKNISSLALKNVFSLRGILKWAFV